MRKRTLPAALLCVHIVAAASAADMRAELKRRYPFSITCERKEDKAQINIEGYIDNWQNSSAGFRGQVTSLVNAGIRDAHVHLNTPGGSTVEANEIVNVIKSFPGKITGSGGALVASAGTNIALHLEDFTMAKNGLWMHHKPSMYTEGNQDEIRNALTLLDTVTDQYRTLYAERSGVSEDDIEAEWSEGDVWLSAQAALKRGFIKGITDEAEMNAEALARIAACGAPKELRPRAVKTTQQPAVETAITNKDTMDPKALRASLGLPETASDAEVMNATNALKARADQADKERDAARTKEVKDLVDAAVKARKITEAHRKGFEAKFNADFDATKAELESIEATPVVATTLRQGAAAPAATGRETWTYEQWMERDEDGLNAMRASDPERFKLLASARYGAKVAATMVDAN